MDVIRFFFILDPTQVVSVDASKFFPSEIYDVGGNVVPADRVEDDRFARAWGSSERCKHEHSHVQRCFNFFVVRILLAPLFFGLQTSFLRKRTRAADEFKPPFYPQTISTVSTNTQRRPFREQTFIFHTGYARRVFRPGVIFSLLRATLPPSYGVRERLSRERSLCVFRV